MLELWKWQKKIQILRRRITRKWHLVWGIKESGPAERWLGLLESFLFVIPVRYFDHGFINNSVLWCQQKKHSHLPPPWPLVSSPVHPPPASCWHKCLRGHTVNPAGELVQAKIILFCLFPCSSNLSQPTRDKSSAKVDLIATYSIHQIIIQAA